MKIVFRPLLIHGMLFKAPEGEWVMLVDSDQTPEELAVTIWHEFVHLLKERAGHPVPHDEKEVDALAERLARACPEIVDFAKARAVPYNEAMLEGRPFMRALAGPNEPALSRISKMVSALLTR